ncbi:hypothetical protein IW262DRAFT_1420759 [Armillaria fumosa]|nr:hypothetical protein IW262DRAFT_1420759 [Armillaria fumosa]
MAHHFALVVGTIFSGSGHDVLYIFPPPGYPLLPVCPLSRHEKFHCASDVFSLAWYLILYMFILYP